MGLVFKAKDFQLGREVALKVLPEGLTADPERGARFEREAKLLASLNHPNIAQIYGLETAPDGTRALVMELAEGPTLADRLAQGALPLDESLSIARQIAEALEEAHERGIIHRDLKPQNIKASTEGKVKVLDFGLAKAMDPAGSLSGGSSAADAARSPTLMNSPTLTAVHGTQLGVILGTAAYMSPEQAKGRTVDKRADIWAFGVVVWECLTGRTLFAGESVVETLGHVLTLEPDFALLPAATPPPLRELLRRCLVRDPKHRLQAIGDARVVLEELAARPGGGPSAAPARSFAASRWLPVGTAALGALAVAGVLALAGWLRPGATGASDRIGAPAPRRVEVAGLSIVDSSSVAISPDGSEIIGYDMTPSRPALLRRSLDSFEVRSMPGTENGFNPFFSPDGAAVGFFADQQVCALELKGSTRRCLARAAGFASGSWGGDGSIVYSSQPGTDPGEGGLWRVPSAGGEPQRLTTVAVARGERSHSYPQVLPDGRHVIFTVLGEVQSSLAVVPIGGGPHEALAAGALRGRYVRSGHLVYWDDPRGRLVAVRFDPASLALAGAPVELGIALASTGDTVPAFEVSDNGTLVYSVSGQFGEDFTVEIATRSGLLTRVVDEPASWAQPRVSPDGRLVLLRRAAQPDCTLWLLDLERRSLSRLAAEGDSHNPLWVGDGERYLISQELAGRSGRQVLEQRLDGGAPPTRVTTTDFAVLAESVSPDGRFVAVTRDGRRDRNDILVFDRETGVTTPFLVTESDEDHPAFSPDGALLAYAANDTGRSEVYVRPYPGPGAKYAVSTHGGTGPVWSRDGRELFYAEGNKLMRVAIERTPRFRASAAQQLFESSDVVWERVRNYDVLPDGSGFLIVRRGAGTPATRSLRVVFDWFTELDRLVP